MVARLLMVDRESRLMDSYEATEMLSKISFVLDPAARWWLILKSVI